ncbi:hypothetical protein NQ315_008049 [Exocentrus adspersus]|uniref:Cuticle protein n=1 Tax=Exocentrus adspersus TaxID=1586481 RepID=A0AAV8VVZ4_9CUCU|nr:hypothetical protein NQ315_008049 [Exocentrus adspersus]
MNGLFSNQYSFRCTSEVIAMFAKILCTVLLVVCTQAIQYDNHHQPLSTVSFNNHHNTIHHIQSAPVIAKAVPVPVHAAPAVHHYTAPIHYAPAPVHETKFAPTHHAASYSNIIGHVAPSSGHGLSNVNAGPALQAGPVLHAAPIVHAAPAAEGHHVEEYVQNVNVTHVILPFQAHPKYEFAYGVEDHHTGDIHSHKESRDGDVTHGEYSLHEADGTIRTVKYSVDKHSGFNAIVERTGHAVHAQPAPVKAVVKAPIAVPIHH